MKIRVGFSTTNTWFSRIIRWVTRSKVSHCYIRVYDEFFDTELVMHVERKMEMLRGEDFNKENIPYEEYIIDDDRLNESIKKNLRHLGKKFDWWDWAGWMPVADKLIKIKIKPPSYRFKKMICVSLVLRILNDAKITHLPYGIFTPELLRQWFDYYHEEFGWKKEILNVNVNRHRWSKNSY